MQVAVSHIVDVGVCDEVAIARVYRVSIEHIEVFIQLFGIEIVKRRRLTLLTIAHTERVFECFSHDIREVQAWVFQQIAMQIIVTGQI